MSKLDELKAEYARAQAVVSVAENYNVEVSARCERMREELHAASIEERPLTADECRMRVIADDTRSWSSTSDMLDDVMGTYDPNEACGEQWQTHYASKKAWHLARAMVDHTRQQWIDAYESGNGVYCFGVQGEYLCRASGKWREFEDGSCFGFYERDQWPSQGTLDAMADYALPGGVKAIDVDVLGEHEEPIEEQED